MAPEARPIASLALLAVLAGACEPDEPVLPGIPEEPILSDLPAPGEAAAPARRKAPKPYEKREDVYIDVRYLGGRSWSEARPIVERQFGSLESTRALPGEKGQEYVFPRGVLRVLDDRIYMIRVPLPEPLRRTDALVALGFPPQVDRWVVLHREYRLNHEWGFRRIRMKRHGRGDELVTEVEAWSWVPGEHDNRR